MIEVAPELDRRSRRRAISDGPPHAATSSTYPRLFRSAGYADVESIDLTSEYRVTAERWLREREQRADDYRSAVGAEVAADRLEQGAVTVRAIDEGLLRRTLYVARLPSSGSRFVDGGGG